MDVESGHSTIVIFAGCDPAGMDVRDDVFFNEFEIFELLIEVAGQQQHGVFQLAFAAVQRALTEITDHDRCPGRDGHDQQHAAKDQPANRTFPNRRSDIKRIDLVGRHSAPAGMRMIQCNFCMTQYQSHEQKLCLEAALRIPVKDGLRPDPIAADYQDATAARLMSRVWPAWQIVPGIRGISAGFAGFASTARAG
nr:hypothetical protein [Bradyrhizobium sp.]